MGSQVNPKYAAGMNNGNLEKRFINDYFAKFSSNHTPKASLTEGEEKDISITMRSSLIGSLIDLGEIKNSRAPWIRDIAMCVKDNLAAIRGQVHLKHVAKMDSGEIESRSVLYYVGKFSDDHASESCLTEREKMGISLTLRSNLTI